MAPPEPTYEPPFRRTFAWVTGGHLLVIVMVLLIAWLAPARSREVKFVNLVELGEMVQGSAAGERRAAPASSSPPPTPAVAKEPERKPVPQAKPPVSEPPPAPRPQPKPKATPKPVKTSTPKPKPPPQPKAQAKPKPKKVASTKRKPASKPSKPKVNVNLKEVKRERTLDKPVKVASSTTSRHQVLKQLTEALDKAGAATAPNLAASSGARNGTQSDHSSYYRLIRDQMFSAWEHPRHLLGQGYQTVIQIRVEADGTISDVELVRSSGHAEHDRTALEAARQVQRLRKPRPAGMDPRVEINFRLQR